MQNIRHTTKFAFLIVTGLLTLGLLIGCTDDAIVQNDNPAPQDDGSISILEIAELITNPSQFQNTVVATGTTTTFLTQGDLTVIGIVDNQHILMCRNLDCVGERIFGVYSGDQELPEPGDVITMTGAFENLEGAWVFVFDDYVATDNIIDLLQ